MSLCLFVIAGLVHSLLGNQIRAFVPPLAVSASKDVGMDGPFVAFVSVSKYILLVQIDEFSRSAKAEEFRYPIVTHYSFRDLDLHGSTAHQEVRGPLGGSWRLDFLASMPSGWVKHNHMPLFFVAQVEPVIRYLENLRGGEVRMDRTLTFTFSSFILTSAGREHFAYESGPLRFVYDQSAWKWEATQAEEPHEQEIILKGLPLAICDGGGVRIN